MFEFITYTTLSVIVGYLLNRLYFSGGRCTSKNRLDGKVVIITGANTGIGRETAKDLAQRGARVILACRNRELAQKAADSIMLETNTTKVEVEVLDLADLSSVRSFASRINSSLSRLDILINNAGVLSCPYWKTKDNFEMQIGVNHLGHFLLTNLLLDLLKKSPSSRIISVSSVVHKNGKIKWDDINSEKSYNQFGAYCQSKLAIILFTLELSKRLKGTSVTAVAIHPGNVRTEVTRHFAESYTQIFPFILKLFYPFYWVISKSPYEGAQTTIHCAVDESISDLSGGYFSDCKLGSPSKAAQDTQAAERLWKLSAQLVNI